MEHSNTAVGLGSGTLDRLLVALTGRERGYEQ